MAILQLAAPEPQHFDFALETSIQLAVNALATSQARSEKVQASRLLVSLIGQRRPAVVARMEAERGLAVRP
jgi:hypothetical protein